VGAASIATRKVGEFNEIAHLRQLLTAAFEQDRHASVRSKRQHPRRVSITTQTETLRLPDDDLNSLAQHLALKGRACAWDSGFIGTHRRRTALLVRVWSAFPLGAALGAAAVTRTAHAPPLSNQVSGSDQVRLDNEPLGCRADVIERIARYQRQQGEPVSLST
jgi:hypothetical protein